MNVVSFPTWSKAPKIVALELTPVKQVRQNMWEGIRRYQLEYNVKEKLFSNHEKVEMVNFISKVVNLFFSCPY